MGKKRGRGVARRRGLLGVLGYRRGGKEGEQVHTSERVKWSRIFYTGTLWSQFLGLMGPGGSVVVGSISGSISTVF